ncbi:MAG: hypothetical protein AAGA21_04885 [Pseudomonadota bacterium]
MSGMMDRTPGNSLVAAAMALLLTAMSSTLAAETPANEAEPIDPKDIPSVHKTFYQVPEDTVSWDVLGAMDIEVEVIAPLKTQMTKSFTEEVKALDDQPVQIMGFLYPLKGGIAHEEFLLTAWPPSCPFCRADADGGCSGGGAGGIQRGRYSHVRNIRPARKRPIGPLLPS